MKNFSFFLICCFSVMSHFWAVGQRVTLSEAGEGVNTTLDPGTRPVGIGGIVGQILYPDPPPVPPPPLSPGAFYMPPAYSTFWIYPDGHFETIEFDSISTFFFNPKAKIDLDSRSNIYCYLTEKYINTEPPEDAITTGKSLIDELTILNYKNDIHNLDLFVNNDPRPGYKMVTAMSYNKKVEANNLYLFYNNIGIDRKGYDLFEATLSETILPDYSKSNVIIEDLTPASYLSYFSDLSEFQNAIHYELKALDSKGPPDWFGRKRIFSVLETKNYIDPKEYPFGDFTNLLGILTSGKGGTLTENEADLARSFGFSVNNNGLCELDSGLYMVGIDTLQQKIVETHDPNHLTLKKVCKEDDFLKLDYELTICNEFTQPEARIDITISGLNGFIINSIDFTNPSSRDETLPPLPLGTFIFYPAMTLAAANHTFPSCDVVTFTVKIPIANSGELERARNMLINHIPFIKYCVKFNSTKAKINECDSQYSFTKIDSNYYVPICDPIPIFHLPFPWWKYLLFVVIVIILPISWYFFRRKKNKI